MKFRNESNRRPSNNPNTVRAELFHFLIDEVVTSFKSFWSEMLRTNSCAFKRLPAIPLAERNKVYPFLAALYFYIGLGGFQMEH